MLLREKNRAEKSTFFDYQIIRTVFFFNVNVSNQEMDPPNHHYHPPPK